MVGKILRALLSHYIKQRAKLTLKKQGNSSKTMSSQNHLTTEPQSTTIATSSAGTSEKIIMGQTTEEIVAEIRQWSIDKIHELSETESPKTDKMYYYMNAMAIAEEFDEWITEYDDPNYQLDIMYLEKMQEVDGEEECLY